MSNAARVAGLLLVVGLLAGPAFAAAETKPSEPEAKGAPSLGVSIARAVTTIGACLSAGVCALAGAVGISRIGGKCMEAMARQPEVAGAMFAPMVISAAMIEGGMLFAIVVCLLALFRA